MKIRARFKAHVLEGGAFLDVADVQTEILDYLEMHYNQIRRRMFLSYKSPSESEQKYYSKQESSL